MAQKERIRVIKKSFQWLYDLGYESEIIERSMYFNKTTNNKTYTINFFWAEFNSIKIQGVCALLRFNNLESIIKEKTKKLNYTIWLKMNLANPRIDAVNSDDHSNRSGIILESEADISNFSNDVGEFYSLKTIPFFSKYTTLKDINEYLVNTEQSDHKNLLCASNNSMMIRKLLIMKEANSEGFHDLYIKYFSFLQQKKNEAPYIEMYNEFMKFENILKEETPYNK